MDNHTEHTSSLPKKSSDKPSYKCLHLITRLANGGAEETVFDLILELAKQEIYCDLAVGKESSLEILEKYPLPSECKIYTITHMVRNPHPCYEILAIKEIRTLIQANNYTIVQTHGSKAGILGRIAAYKEHVPVIIGMIHGISFPLAMAWPARMLYKNLERYVAKKSSALVCVGEDMKKKYIAAKIGAPHQYSVIYTGMRLNNFSNVKNRGDKERQDSRKRFSMPTDLHTIVIGSIGRLENRKNQKALISMMPKILQTNSKVHLCIIGDGPNLSMLSTLAENLGIKNNISFTGYVKDIWNVLNAVDIHCMTSLWEGLPRVLVQTSAAGLPNVCYEVDGVWEIIKDKESGFIVNYGDEQTYINNLLSLINDTEKRKSFGHLATKLADDRWSLEKFGYDMQKLYDSLLL